MSLRPASLITITALLSATFPASPADASERLWTRVGGFGAKETAFVSRESALPRDKAWHKQPRPPRFSKIVAARRVTPHAYAEDPYADGLFLARYTLEELASAAYAETGGLYPAKVKPGSIYDVSTYRRGDGPGSSGDLRRARMMIAETRKLNKKTHLRAKPPASDELSMRVWDECVEAAKAAVAGEVYPLGHHERLHFFIRQEGVGRRTAAYLKNYEPVASYGPFINVGGGDVPRGDRTHVDFYVLPAW